LHPERSVSLCAAGKPRPRVLRNPRRAMVHLAMQEALDGKQVDWLEHVTHERCREMLEN
jgi:hypothetical protein